MQQSRILTVTIDRPFDEAYAFAQQPANFAKWAAGLATTLHHTEAGWVADTPAGEARVTFSERNAFGVLDHRVEIRDRPAISIPLRMIANGDGTDVQLTLFRQPEMTDAMFEGDAASVIADLEALRALLESGEA